MNGELNAWKCQAGKDGWCTLLVHQPASEASEAGAVPALMLQWGLESSPSSPRSRLSMSSINVKLIIINLQWQNWQKNHVILTSIRNLTLTEIVKHLVFFLNQSLVEPPPLLQERKSRLSTKQLRCLASLFCTPSLPPTQHFEMSHKWKDSILAKHLLHNGITQELCVPATGGLNEPDWRPDKNKTVWSTQRQKTNFENLPIGPCLAWMIYQTPHTIRWSSSLDWPFVRETCGRDSIPGDPPLCQIASSARAFFFRTPQIAHKYNIKPLIDQNKEDCTLVNEKKIL